MRTIIIGAAVAAAIAAALPRCARSPGASDLYVLEELEAASNISDPADRVRRLEIFVRNHPGHPYRVEAWQKMLDAMAEGPGDSRQALERFDGALAGERDPALRGRMLFSKFQFLWEADSLSAVDLARRTAAGNDTDFRLLMYMAYYLMEAEGQEETAEAVFRRLIDVTSDPLRLAHARTIYAEFLEGRGREEEAYEQYRLASPYPFAEEKIAGRLWERGERGAAIDAWIEVLAGLPGASSHVNLDSLYAIASPGASDLAERIAAARIAGDEMLPDRSFVDIRGRRHSIAGYGGRKLVIVAFSPT